MTDTTRGVLAMIGACTIWGLSPLFYKLLVHVPPLEILAHRTLWSLIFFGGVVAVQRRGADLWRLMQRRWFVVAPAAALISVNWGLYIWAVQVDRVMEASLGYYIFPLVAVLLGAVVFGERLTPVAWLAVALAATGVSALAFGLGLVPYVALMLATTFGLYGMFKKRLSAGAVLSVTGEVLLLSPLAIGWLVWLNSGAQAGPVATDARSLALLALSGPLTAGPLILFSLATQKIRMATVGLLQYLNPTLQFLCAAMVFAEPFTRWHGLAFGLIWAALAIYSGQAWLAERSRLSRVGTSGTV